MLADISSVAVLVSATEQGNTKIEDGASVAVAVSLTCGVNMAVASV